MLSSLLVLLSIICFAQEKDSVKITEKRFFSTYPNKIAKLQTNGVAVGVLDDYKPQHQINGLNLQFNPLVLIYPLLPKAIPIPDESSGTVSINGIHISTSGLSDGNVINGLAISAYHHAVKTNGISFNLFNNSSGKLNGIHSSFFANNANMGNGIFISFLGNSIDKMNGIQIGCTNDSESVKGIQIGLFNTTKKLKGLQIGLWNKNAKRVMPIINF